MSAAMADGALPLALGGTRFRGFAPDALFALMETFGLSALDYWDANRGTLEREEFLALAAQHRIGIFAVNIPDASKRMFAPGEDGDAMALARRELMAGLDLAHTMGARYLSIYPANVSEWPDFRTTVKMIARELRPVIERAEDLRVTVMLENTINSFQEGTVYRLNPSRLPELMLALVEEIDSPAFRLVFDPCNWYVMGVEPYPYAYELLRNAIATIHVKDCCRYSPLAHYGARNSNYLFDTRVGRGFRNYTAEQAGTFLPVPVGQGALNWERMIGRFRDDGFGDRMTLDPFCDPQRVVDWVEESLHFLREQFSRSRRCERP